MSSVNGQMSTVFFGTSPFAVPILEALAQSKWRPAVVITAPDHPAGRGLKPKPSPVKQKALGLGLEVWEPEHIKDPTWADHIASLKSGLILLAAYGKIIPGNILALPRSGSLNVHPSLLPRWRGPAPIQYALLEGDAETGVTIFVMDEEMDHGPIVAQASTPIAAEDTTESLEKKLSALGAPLLLQILPRFLAGEIIPQPQDHAKATFSKLIKKEAGLIDWSRPAEDIARRIRAFSAWPGSFTFWHRNAKPFQLTIVEARSHPKSIFRHFDISSHAPGTIFAESEKLFVAAGDGALEILELRPESKKSMTARQFLNGYAAILGSTLR